MPYLDRDDPEYWQVPERLRPVAERTLERGGRLSYLLLGPDGPETPTVMLFEMEPGFVIRRHAHQTPRVEVIVRGSLDVGDRVLVAGDVMISDANELYGPKVAGPEGCTTAEVFPTLASATNPIYPLRDGTVFQRDLLGDDPLPDDIAGMEWVDERGGSTR